MLLKERRNKKVDKFKNNLRQKNFSSKEIGELEKMYVKVMRLSNIFLFTMFMYAISILLIVMPHFLKSSPIYEFKDLIFYLFASLSAILAIFSSILVLILIIQIFASSVREVKREVLPWAIVTIIPIPFISTITLFIVKWKIKSIYKYR